MELNYSFTKICAEVRRRNNERTDKKKKIRCDRNSNQSYSVVHHLWRANITQTNRAVPQYSASVGCIFLILQQPTYF